MKNIPFTLIPAFLLLTLCSYAQLPAADDTNWVNKVKHVAAQTNGEVTADKQTAKAALPPAPKPTDKSASTLSLIRPSSDLNNNMPKAALDAQEDKEGATDAPAASNAQVAQSQAPKMITKTDSKEMPATHPQKTQETAPKAKKSNVDWIESSSGNFNIKIERRKTGITTPNLAMKFETIHQILRKNISWMMGGKTDVYVYQDRASFLRNEPVASGWAGAFFSPSDNRIVMYDEPNNINRMIQQFSHELTHLFVENFFNPRNKPHRLEPPIWLNEGLAVNMEDISISSYGGVWASDLIVINIFSAGDKKLFVQMKNSGEQLNLKDKNILSTKVVFFKNFNDFVKNNSYDQADQNGDVENWYFQAYAMVRFLFKPYNAAYPEKRMQFEQFTKLLSTFEQQTNENGKPLKDAEGKIVMRRTSVEAALRKAYGYKNINDFEVKFWAWLKALQQSEREKIRKRGL